MQPSYFIYRYIRLDKNVPFYIGLGKRQDFNSQGYPLYSYQSIYGRAFSKDRSKVCLGIMNSTPYEIEIIYETENRKHAEEKEKEFIKLYGSVYDGSGTLVNLTEGGVSFKPKDELIKQKRFAHERNGTKLENKKRLFMYDLNGNFIEEFEHLIDFYRKYKQGDKSGVSISQSIRENTSCKGYYFSFEKYDKLDISNKKIASFHRLPFVKYDQDFKPLKIYSSSKQLAYELNVDGGTIFRKAKNGTPINGFYIKQLNVHELPTI